MPLIRRTVQAAVAACLRRSPAYTDPAHLDALLTEQTANATRQIAAHAAGSTAMNTSALHVQPGVLEVRSSVLADTHYLEGMLIAARSRGMAPELIDSLADAVDIGHELTAVLADTAHATITAPTAGH
ncbi:hypothetical protein ACFVW9_36225 [Streptomyces sp. NPDC058217]|uniref:hypothetical protein n=1 Tax=Streptomyces sp. NPDC058217 TaxID=3346384 RepID=UPI0036EBDFA3